MPATLKALERLMLIKLDLDPEIHDTELRPYLSRHRRRASLFIRRNKRRAPVERADRYKTDRIAPVGHEHHNRQ